MIQCFLESRDVRGGLIAVAVEEVLQGTLHLLYTPEKIGMGRGHERPPEVARVSSHHFLKYSIFKVNCQCIFYI